MSRPVFQSPTTTNPNRRPVVFDVLGPDRSTSLLPDGIRLVLHVNPSNVGIELNREITRIQTRGGFVEQHWGDSTQKVSIEASTGGFMRLYGGLSNTTNPRFGGSRRETIAYDKYLDMLALFNNNGSVFDATGQVIMQGVVQMTYDGYIWQGWFTDFSVAESAEKPFLFELQANFEVEKEILSLRSTPNSEQVSYTVGGVGVSGVSDPFIP